MLYIGLRGFPSFGSRSSHTVRIVRTLSPHFSFNNLPNEELEELSHLSASRERLAVHTKPCTTDYDPTQVPMTAQQRLWRSSSCHLPCEPSPPQREQSGAFLSGLMINRCLCICMHGKSSCHIGWVFEISHLIRELRPFVSSQCENYLYPFFGSDRTNGPSNEFVAIFCV